MYLRGPIGFDLNGTGTTRVEAIINEGVSTMDDLVDLYVDMGINFF